MIEKLSERMDKDMTPKIKLRNLQLDDVEDRYKWSLDREVTKYLSVPDKYPPFTKDETKKMDTIVYEWNKWLLTKVNFNRRQYIHWLD